ncbi:MAG: hypothetical protein RBU25_11270 [Lentisphaeria bacterium]|jgi:cell division protein FtsB|nr:hypothetical protein [Lentisphaeria bacterium]
MTASGDRGARRKLILLLLALVLAVVFTVQFSGFLPGEWPTKSLINEQAKELRAARKQLARLSQEGAQGNRRLQDLQDQSAPFWTVSSERQAEQEIIEHFNRAARNAQINKHQINKPRSAPLPNYAYLYEVEFSVSLTSTMKEITRLLQEMEKTEHLFQWTQCSISVLNRRAPTEVRLTGKVRAVVLRPEARAILEGKQEGQG